MLNKIEASTNKHYVEEFKENGQSYQSSYSYITDIYFKPLAILNLPYIEDDGFLNKELKENLTRLGVCLFYYASCGDRFGLFYLKIYYTFSKRNKSEDNRNTSGQTKSTDPY